MSQVGYNHLSIFALNGWQVTHGMLEAYYSGHAQAAETLRKHFDWFNSNDTLPRMLPPRGGANIPGLPFQNRKDPQFTAGHLVPLLPVNAA